MQHEYSWGALEAEMIKQPDNSVKLFVRRSRVRLEIKDPPITDPRPSENGRPEAYARGTTEIYLACALSEAKKCF